MKPSAYLQDMKPFANLVKGRPILAVFEVTYAVSLPAVTVIFR